MNLMLYLSDKKYLTSPYSRHLALTFMVIMGICLGFCSLAEAADVEFIATVDRTTLSKSQTLTLTLQAEGSVSKLADPTLPDLSDFSILSGPNESSTFQIINGKYSLIKAWSFVLRPRKTGSLIIGSAEITHKKQMYKTEPITVVVSGTRTAPQAVQQGQTEAGKSNIEPDELFVKVTADKSTLYQNEQVILTYTIYTRVNVNSYEISKLPGAPGFWSEEFKLSQQPTVQDQVIAGRHYRKALIRKVALFPTRTGELTVDPLEITCQVQVQESRKRRRDPFDLLFDSPFSRYRTEERFTETEPLKLNVLPLPSAGKPDSFSGAVGDFNMEVSLDRTKVTTNDALSMTVRFSGTGNIKLLQEPDFTAPPDFESYDPKESVKVNKSGKRVTGSKTFEYVLIPRVPGTSQIPPIEFTYFDPASKSYKTIVKGGFAVEVEKGDGDAIAALPGISKKDVKLLAEDIHYLMTPGRLLQVGSANLIPLRYWIAMSLPPLLAVILFWTARLMGASTLRARRKDRKIYAKAKRDLQALAKSASGSGGRAADVSNVHGAVHGILLAYLGKRLKIPASGLKEEEVLKRLKDLNVQQETVSALEEIFQECNLARFAPQQADQWELSRIIKRAGRILDKMEERWHAPRSKKSGTLTILLLTVVLITFNSIGQAQKADDFDPVLAENLYRSGDYTAAISIYEQIIESGWMNGKIYYNLGNCYYKMGQYGRSILYYERAKRLLGRNDDLLINLKLANLRIYDRIEPLPRFFVIRIFNSVADSLTVRSWARLFIISEWLLLLAFSGLYFLRNPRLRRPLVWCFIIFLSIGIASGGLFRMAACGNI